TRDLGIKSPHSGIHFFGSSKRSFGLNAGFAGYYARLPCYSRICPAKCPTKVQLRAMAAPQKLSDSDVKKIRRRVRAGEQQTLLAIEYGVNRKTIRRRLDEFELAERVKADRVAAKRLQRQAAREKRKMLQRDRPAGHPPPFEHGESSDRSPRQP